MRRLIHTQSRSGQREALIPYELGLVTPTLSKSKMAVQHFRFKAYACVFSSFCLFFFFFVFIVPIVSYNCFWVLVQFELHGDPTD